MPNIFRMQLYWKTSEFYYNFECVCAAVIVALKFIAAKMHWTATATAIVMNTTSVRARECSKFNCLPCESKYSKNIFAIDKQKRKKKQKSNDRRRWYVDETGFATVNEWYDTIWRRRRQGKETSNKLRMEFIFYEFYENNWHTNI